MAKFGLSSIYNFKNFCRFFWKLFHLWYCIWTTTSIFEKLCFLKLCLILLARHSVCLQNIIFPLILFPLGRNTFYNCYKTIWEQRLMCWYLGQNLTYWPPNLRFHNPTDTSAIILNYHIFGLDLDYLGHAFLG